MNLPPNILHSFRRLTESVLSEVECYLDECGIKVPSYKLEHLSRFGGSHVTVRGSSLTLHLGNYPTRYIASWWIMHEMGHLLWELHQPCRDRVFKRHFGCVRPPEKEYLSIHRRHSSRGPVAAILCLRHPGEPSSYGMLAGGEERFCELLALMYATGGFDRPPPADLEELWEVCWTHGLSNMVA